MQTALRKMGNSTGLVLPKPILKVVATPIKRKVREGWEEDAKRIGAEALTAEDCEWIAFGNERDEALKW
jgi:antitoxin MazE